MDSGRIDDQREICGFGITNKAAVITDSLGIRVERPSPYMFLLHLIYRKISAHNPFIYLNQSCLYPPQMIINMLARDIRITGTDRRKKCGLCSQ